MLKAVYIKTIVKNNIPNGSDESKKNLLLLNSTGKNVKTKPPIISKPNQIVADEKNRTFVTFIIETLYNEYNLYLIEPPKSIEYPVLLPNALLTKQVKRTFLNFKGTPIYLNAITSYPPSIR